MTGLNNRRKIETKNGKLVGKYPLRWSPDFICAGRGLVSLEGAPAKVGSNFLCHNNKLESLKGISAEIGGGLWCYQNDTLTSIQNINHHVKKIGGGFNADDNLTGLISLLMIEQPPNSVNCGYLSAIFNDAIKKILAGQDRMEVIMDVIIKCPEEHAWQLGDIE